MTTMSWLRLLMFATWLTSCRARGIHEETADIAEIDKPQGQTRKTPSGASLFEGDLLVTFQEVADNYGLEFAERLRRSGFVFMEPKDEGRSLAVQIDKRWPSRQDDGKVQIPYQIEDHPHYDEESRSIIKSAMDELETSGVLKFIERTTEPDYLSIEVSDIQPNECYSYGVGYSGGPHLLNFGWCNKVKWSIVHEILHALGFWHEHTRPDRDAYVTIDPSNRNDVANYGKRNDVDSLGSPYDFDSLMHYFLSTSSQRTMTSNLPLPDYTYVGQRSFISKHDMDQIRWRYQCASGSREGPSITPEDYCTVDCPCWENAMGECDSDDECQGQLVCGDPVQPPPPTPPDICKDSIIPFEDAPPRACLPTDCDRYSISHRYCRETCDVPCYPEEENIQLPSRMCVRQADPMPSPQPQPTPDPSQAPTTTKPPTVQPTSFASSSAPTTSAPQARPTPEPTTPKPPTVQPTSSASSSAPTTSGPQPIPTPEPTTPKLPTVHPTSFASSSAPTTSAPQPMPTPEPTAVPATPEPAPVGSNQPTKIIIRPPIGTGQSPSSTPAPFGTSPPKTLQPSNQPTKIIIRPPIGTGQSPSSTPAPFGTSPPKSQPPSANPPTKILKRPPVGGRASPGGGRSPASVTSNPPVPTEAPHDNIFEMTRSESELDPSLSQESHGLLRVRSTSGPPPPHVRP